MSLQRLHRSLFPGPLLQLSDALCKQGLTEIQPVFSNAQQSQLQGLSILQVRRLPGGQQWQHPCNYSSSANLQTRPDRRLSLPPKLQAALQLQATSLWQRHKNKVYLATGGAAVWILWRSTYLVASSFMTVQQTMAEWGLMGMSIAAVAAAAQYMRWYWGVNPAAVYRQAMLQLNTSPAVLEVMGAPLLGSDLRAYILTGGHVYLSRKHTFKPKMSARRIQMLFPIRGSERDGLVSLEAKRKQGRYVFKLLTVDVKPGLENTTTNKSAARLYIEGTATEYDKGSALGELRDPFLKAVDIQQQVDRDEQEEDDELQDSLRSRTSHTQATSAGKPSAPSHVSATTTAGQTMKTEINTAPAPSTELSRPHLEQDPAGSQQQGTTTAHNHKQHVAAATNDSVLSKVKRLFFGTS